MDRSAQKVFDRVDIVRDEIAHLVISLVIWSIAGCIVGVVRWNQLTSEESTQSASNSGKNPK
jgi:hypothetical protein